jgi:putative transposase
MLNQEDLLSWLRRLEISEQAQSLIGHIRSSVPARRVGGGNRNVSGRYPSRKMGTIIQFESHRVELAAIYEMEYDADVLEYWDQPPSIKLDYRSPAGRRMGVLHTPDFFVMRQHSAGWEEWKAEESLQKLAKHNPNRYCLEDGHWRCPPGEKYALALGFYYRVRSSTEINWVFQRNVQFLEDYLRADVVVISPLIRETAVSHVAAAPGLSLAELFSRTGGSLSRDQIHSLIAAGVLHVDLHRSVLVEPERVTVFPSLNALTGANASHLPLLRRWGYQTFWPARLSFGIAGHGRSSTLEKGR